MKEQQEQILVIHINLTRGLATLLTLTLLTAALLVTLVWGRGEAVASNPQVPPAAYASMRQYYLTGSAVSDATQALNACEAGYHMASLWEILDTSNLKYNATLGYYQQDSGSGPPTVWMGWVRTGYNSNNGSTPGQANCSNWTSTSGWGTYVGLPSNWTSGAQDMHVWNVGVTSCGSPARVWCVED